MSFIKFETIKSFSTVITEVKIKVSIKVSIDPMSRQIETPRLIEFSLGLVPSGKSVMD